MYGYGTGTAKSLGGKVIPGYVTTDDEKFVRYRGSMNDSSISKGTLLTQNQVNWQTLRLRGLLTLTTTAVNPFNLGHLVANVNSTPVTGATFGRFGINNTKRTKEDYVSVSGRLVVKLKVRDSAIAKATTRANTIVDRTTITRTVLPFSVSSALTFPTMTGIADRLVDRQAKQGDITGDFRTMFVWANQSNNLRSKALTTSIGVDGGSSHNRVIHGATGEITAPLGCFSDSICVRNTHRLANLSNTDLRINGDFINALNTAGTNGFFSAAAFTVDALVAKNFGEFATVRAGDSDAKNLPFRVLFFDNDEADNGLYLISGSANYNNGALTGINTAPTKSSAIGGKHTIVRLTGVKGHPIELSDINLV